MKDCRCGAGRGSDTTGAGARNTRPTYEEALAWADDFGRDGYGGTMVKRLAAALREARAENKRLRVRLRVNSIAWHKKFHGRTDWETCQNPSCTNDHAALAVSPPADEPAANEATDG